MVVKKNVDVQPLLSVVDARYISSVRESARLQIGQGTKWIVIFMFELPVSRSIEPSHYIMGTREQIDRIKSLHNG